MYLVVAVTVLEFTAELIVEFNPLLGNLCWDTCPVGIGVGHSGWPFWLS